MLANAICYNSSITVLNVLQLAMTGFTMTPELQGTTNMSTDRKEKKLYE